LLTYSHETTTFAALFRLPGDDAQAHFRPGECEAPDLPTCGLRFAPISLVCVAPFAGSAGHALTVQSPAT